MADKKQEHLLNRHVFFISMFFLLLFAVVTNFAPEASTKFLEQLQNKLSSSLGWYYMSITAVYLFFIIWLGFSRFGSIRLGPPDSKPEFSYRSWVSMLFSSGIGISLLYFGASEAIQHYLEPPNSSVVAGGQIAPSVLADQAVMLSFLHWGVHGWAIYALIAIVLAYFAYRFNQPLTLKTAFYPILGKHTHGLPGNLIDCFGIIVTVCGLISNLGIGALQIRAGIAHIFGLPESYSVLITCMIVMSVIAALVAISGIEVGIQRLANFNTLLFIALMFFILCAGPTLFLINGFVQNIGAYFSQVFFKTFDLYVYDTQSDHTWLSRWTIFYWAWWISWGPFIGLFIARISRGRTIREVVFGVLLIPLVFTLFCLSILGNSILYDHLFGNGTIFQLLSTEQVLAHPESMIYLLLSHYPGSTFLLGLTTIVGFILFLTPADSGAVMLTNLSIYSKHGQDGPIWLRVFWSFVIFAITAGLMFNNNILSIQTTIILASLPFSLIIVCYMLAFLRQIKQDPFYNQQAPTYEKNAFSFAKAESENITKPLPIIEHVD